METFNVALSADFRKPDGTPAFPMFDLSPLDDDPRVNWSFVPITDGWIAADDIRGFDALILLASRFDRQSIPDDGRLAVVARFGVGYDAVDVDACTDNDIALVITPSGVRRPVAVAIMTFVLALAGKMMAKDRITREGPDGWARRGQYMGQGLVGLTLGSIGVGNIGAELFALAAPFGLLGIAHDPYVDGTTANALGIEMVSLEDVFRRADFVCVNCPLTDETEGLVNAERLALMKPTAYLINTARGPIVDQDALTAALTDRVIAGAGIDVFETEPPAADDPLLALDNVILAPHALCWTDQCFADIGAADIRAVFDVMAGRVPDGVVNRDVLDRPGWQARLDRYRSLAGDS
ncbi:NAD(P)-dependent oxidoreductase [Bauldia sp.]|uniref:NAD(P)-dependent oxidoreductase n=1 Tax=Bauldia sp. TaxID=2575872 RepID=UPI003BA8DA35